MLRCNGTNQEQRTRKNNYVLIILVITAVLQTNRPGAGGESVNCSTRGRQPMLKTDSSHSPILTGKPGGKRKVMKSRSFAKWALEMAMRSMMGVTCSARDRG